MRTITILFFSTFTLTFFCQKNLTDTLNFADGNPKRTSFYNKTAKEWTVINYYETNNVRSIIHYDSTGYTHAGRQNYFDLQGELIAFIEFQNGRLNGQFKEYYLNGKIKTQGQIVNDCRDGQWIEYYSNGKIKTTNSYKAFYFADVSDIDRKKINYLNIRYCGREELEDQPIVLKKYDLKTAKETCGEYLFCVDGQKVGTWLTYDENGKILEKVKY